MKNFENAVLSDEELYMVAGGRFWESHEMGSASNYNKYGVETDFSIMPWNADKFYYQGQEISEDDANIIVFYNYMCKERWGEPFGTLADAKALKKDDDGLRPGQRWYPYVRNQIHK